MIVIDSSVWIDYFSGNPSKEADRLDALLGIEPVAIGDLILLEVLQGFRADSDFRRARDRLLALPVVEMLGAAAAVRGAAHYRMLRRRGVTIRRTADVVIATACIRDGHSLLFADRDFEPFVEHLGLERA
ncbi:MAG TPA: PIN domain nuclease [Dermatophilaceae bacterium]|nr:PIN domain nuclease [Dermatophilaceae bacterium]